MRDNYSSEIEEMLDTHAQELEDKAISLKHLVSHLSFLNKIFIKSGIARVSAAI